ncbi:MAG: hypothetical protein J2P36_33045, partial [Ktedonobacteraceae bacterium]|nr:hypothetical protein [Ktedonobacteraceae bacterium]
MESLFQYSYLILLAPLLAFAVIVFGTRMADLASRPRTEAQATHDEHHAADGHGGHGEHDDQDFDDDPKAPQLTIWARASAYVAITLMALACLYSWILLLTTIASPDLQLKASTQVLAYDWVSFGKDLLTGKALTQPLNYTIAFHLDTLAIAMMVVVTTVTLLVQIYSQGYMENSAGYARFFSYLSLFA